MKKFLSVVLSLVIAFSFVAPVYAQAAEIDSSMSELEELACQVFPEYAEKIRNPQLPKQGMRSGAEREIVISETRKVSDTRLLNYTESSDGLILLSDYDLLCKVYDDNWEQQGSIAHHTVKIRMYLDGFYSLRYATLGDVEFSIYPNTYDRITNAGSFIDYTPTYAKPISSQITQSIEAGPNDPAEMKAEVNFLVGSKVDGDYWEVEMCFKVGNNQFSTEIKNSSSSSSF